MKEVQVGMWKLPGLAFEKYQLSQERIDEMTQWSAEANCGMFLTDTLWSFRNTKQRDWFILRWSEVLEKDAAA